MKIDIIKWEEKLNEIWPALIIADMEINQDSIRIRIKYDLFDFDNYIPFCPDINDFIKTVKTKLRDHLQGKIKYSELSIRSYKNALKIFEV